MSWDDLEGELAEMFGDFEAWERGDEPERVAAATDSYKAKRAELWADWYARAKLDPAWRAKRREKDRVQYAKKRSTPEKLAEHRKRQAAYQRASTQRRRRLWRAQGLCPRCGSAPAPGSVRCARCKSQAVVEKTRSKRLREAAA